MKFKGTTVLFIVFVLLGGYVYLTEFRGREERQKQEEAKKKVFQAEQKDITEISLAYPDRTITAVKKGEKQWEMTSPAGLEADPDEWEMLASNILGVEREDTVAENATDVTPFGLNEPPVKVAAKLADGRSIEISFGGENPKKTHNYARASSGGEVFLTASNWSKTFTKTISDLRNKKVLELASDAVDSVKISEGTKEIELQKSGEDWLLKKPIEAKADSGEITTFLSSIGFARATSFAEPPVDAKTAGLDPPDIRITLHDGKANADRVLLIGKTVETDKHYARDASRNTIFVIQKDIADKVRRPIFEWRDKSITTLDREKIGRIELLRGSETTSLLKAGSDWKLPDDKKLQWDKISGMLNTLEFEKAKDIIDAPKSLSPYGLDKPRLEVVFKESSNELGRIAFGSDSKMPEGIYLKTSGGPAVQVVSKDVFDKFNVKAEELVDNSPPPAAPAVPAAPPDVK